MKASAPLRRRAVAALLLAPLLVAARPAPPPAADPALEEAKQLFAEGETAYKMGAFEEALLAFSNAYEKKPVAGFLFNLGQCHRQLGNHERAVFFFQGYLRDKPDARNRAMVEGLIAESKKALEAERLAAEKAEQERLAEEARRREAARRAEEAKREEEAHRRKLVEAAAAALVSSQPPPAAEPALYERWWFWAAVGGVAVAAGGAAFALSGDEEPAPGPTVPPSGSLGTLDRRAFTW